MHMDSCMRAYATVQQLPCHGRYCELILSLARTLCRLSFPAHPPSFRPPPCNPNFTKYPSKSTLAHDVVAAAMLHKHHPIIRVGAGLIQFVYGLHSRWATGVTSSKNLFPPSFGASFIVWIDLQTWTSTSDVNVYTYSFVHLSRTHTRRHASCLCLCLSTPVPWADPFYQRRPSSQRMWEGTS